MYGFPLYAQLKCLVFFLGLGFLLGLVYDILRILRLSVSRAKSLLYVCDCLFALIFVAAVYCTSILISYGELHLYMLLGSVSGFVVYYITLDGFVRKATDRLVRALQKTYGVLFRAFSLPVRLFVCGAEKMSGILGIPVKKIAKFLKYLLQNVKKLLYNVNGFHKAFKRPEINKKEENHF